MKELKCEYGECNATLSSVPEIATGICNKHRNLLMRQHHYAVVCWHCGSIRLIEPAPVQGGEKLIKDKYIFTRTCPKCDETSDGNRWMNNPKVTDKSEVVLDDGLTLHPTSHGLVAGPKRKISHKTPRSTATGDLSGEDIITKIQLRAKADKQLETFLDRLEIKTGNDDDE